jgi:lipid-A-disaccharide synthase
MSSILIVAGESSGEKHGASLVHELKKIQPSWEFFGIGGKWMKKEGVEVLFAVEELAVVGAVEIISQVPRIRKIFNQILKQCRSRSPAAAVLVDSPDFNLRLAKKLKKLSIPVLYFISPTVWAWRKARLKTIKKTVEKMLLIFPFEESIYKENGIPATYVGHPLLERVSVTLNKKEFFRKYGLHPKKRLIAILPGSRKSEIKYHLPILMEAIPKIRDEFSAQFVLIQAETLEKDFLLSSIISGVEDLKILTEDSYNAMAASDLVLSACGTANLEAALVETPLIAFYRISYLSYWVGLKLMKIKNFSIVNILAEKKIIPELIQSHFTAQTIFDEAKKILDSEKVRAEMIREFRRIKALLGEKKASQNAALELERMIHSRAQ